MDRGRSEAPSAIEITPLAVALERPESAAELDDIFFTSSVRTAFASEAERVAFRAFWLDRYLAAGGEPYGFAACQPTGEIAGYIVCEVTPAGDASALGALLDPKRGYAPSWGDLVRAFPAHLHINVAAHARSAGLGARLVEHAVAALARDGVVGVHLLTSADSRNVRFYKRCGFVEQARSSPPDGSAIVFLGRKIP